MKLIIIFYHWLQPAEQDLSNWYLRFVWAYMRLHSWQFAVELKKKKN